MYLFIGKMYVWQKFSLHFQNKAKPFLFIIIRGDKTNGFGIEFILIFCYETTSQIILVASNLVDRNQFCKAYEKWDSW